VSGDLDRSNGAGHGGPARGYSWPPFEPGHTLSVRSGFWIDPQLREEHRAELAEIEAVVAESLPYPAQHFALAVSQLALRLWRQRRAYRDLDELGLIRDGKSAPILDHLAKLESRIMSDLEALGLTPRSASELIERARSADPFAELRDHLQAKRETVE
jgi:hypothetical protein